MHDVNNMSPLTPSRSNGQSKSLAIAFVVSAVFLLAAAGVSYWLLTKPAGAPSAQQPGGDGSETIKNVSWVSPDALPSQYARRDQNTQHATTTYYFDAAAGCGITTTVQPVSAGTTAKQGVLDAAKAAQAYGIATNSSADAAEVTIKDQDDKSYAFQALTLEQSVAVPGVPYTAQRTVVAFKQLGQQFATVGYSCRSDVATAKHTEMQALVSAFKIKTE